MWWKWTNINTFDIDDQYNGMLKQFYKNWLKLDEISNMAKIYLDLKIMDWMEPLHAVSRKAWFTEKISIDGWHAWNDIEKNIYMSEMSVYLYISLNSLFPMIISSIVCIIYIWIVFITKYIH